MAVKTVEDLMSAVQAYIGDRTDDDTLNLITDIRDTATATTANQAAIDEAVAAKDAEWRQKYRDTFFSPGGADKGTLEDEKKDEPKRTYESLFKEV